MKKIYMQYFEWYLPEDQLLWKRVAKQANELKSLGITTIWLPPAYKGAFGVHDSGYAVYDLYDLGEFNQKDTIGTKYGTKDEYIKAIEALHKEGIKVLADTVLNHKMGADESEFVNATLKAWKNRNEEISVSRQIEAWTRFTFPSRNKTYSDFTWNHTHFNGIDWDEKNHEKGIFLFEGKQWSQEVDRENGNYDYLMGADLDMSNPEVVNECIHWGQWYLNTSKVDGFRFDAVKHINADFFNQWIKEVQAISDKPLSLIGEYWNPDLAALLNFINETKEQIRLFDVALHYHLQQASSTNGAYDMRDLFKGTLVECKPELAITFVDNHDTQPNQALQSWVEEWFKGAAYAIILLYPYGTPCIFYGDMYGIPHNQLNSVDELPTLMLVSKHYAFGDFHPYIDHSDLIGWSQCGDNKHSDSGYALLITNAKGGNKRMYVGKQYANQSFYDCLQHIEQPIFIDQDGYGDFIVEDGSFSLYVNRNAYESISINLP